VELIYTSKTTLKSCRGLFTVLSDTDDSSRHTAVLELAPGVDTNSVIAAVIEQNVAINSFKELVPRMNDIFIKLIKED
jgi:hypothetical protein